MKLVKNQLIKLIRKSLLKEFKSSGENFTITPPSIDIPGLDSGGGFPPVEPPKDRGRGESCDDFGPKYDKAYGIVLGTFNEIYVGYRNHIIFLTKLHDSGIQLPNFEASKDVIDYVTDEVIHLLAYDICRMKIQPNQLFTLLNSPFDLLYGGYLPGAGLN
tara:strand:+ start:112 stop:591 length:480 start_codon:yes stop_codon:yes gene_type:complete